MYERLVWDTFFAIIGRHGSATSGEGSFFTLCHWVGRVSSHFTGVMSETPTMSRKKNLWSNLVLEEVTLSLPPLHSIQKPYPKPNKKGSLTVTAEERSPFKSIGCTMGTLLAPPTFFKAVEAGPWKPKAEAQHSVVRRRVEATFIFSLILKKCFLQQCNTSNGPTNFEMPRPGRRSNRWMIRISDLLSVLVLADLAIFGLIFSSDHVSPVDPPWKI